jgi:GT2 family glycosyltransferase
MASPPDSAAAENSATAEMRVTVVVITHNRREELARTLHRLATLPTRPPVIVVDNGSRDGTADFVRREYPEMTLIAADRNLGAVGRNLAARRVETPYIAFCDDDTWWEPGALVRAADLLDSHANVAAITGHIVVEPEGSDDPIVAELRDSPIPRPPGARLPGPALGSILAGASVLRTSAFRQVGGFNPRLWLGGEEELLAMDLAACGWWLCYAPDVIVHHEPSTRRESTARRRDGIRNTLWTTWLRRPVTSALRRTVWLAGSVPRDRTSASGFFNALRGLPWVLRERRVVPANVEANLRLLEVPQRTSTARRYVG